MKKVLLASSALIAAGAIAAPAQAADPIKIGVGGYYHWLAINTSQDDNAGQPGANTHQMNLRTESEISFSGSTKLDNGVTVGVNIQLEAETCGDQIDESYIFFKGGFGEVLLGHENGAKNKMTRGAPGILAGWTSVWSTNFRHYSNGGNAAQPFINDVSGDNNKITWFTPKINGFRLGASYTWDSGEDIGSYGGPQADNTAADQSNIYELGAEYGGKGGSVAYNVSFTYQKGELEADAAGAEDFSAWAIGGDVSMSGITIGAGYNTDNQSTSAADTDVKAWNLGATYTTGPWTVGMAYGTTKNEAGTGGGEDSRKAMHLGATYAFGPGISLSAGLENVKLDDNANAAANENDATSIILGTALFF